MPVNESLVPLLTCTLTDAIVCLATMLIRYCLLNTIIVIIIEFWDFSWSLLCSTQVSVLVLGIGIAKGQYYLVLDIGCLFGIVLTLLTSDRCNKSVTKQMIFVGCFWFHICTDWTNMVSKVSFFVQNQFCPKFCTNFEFLSKFSPGIERYCYLICKWTVYWFPSLYKEMQHFCVLLFVIILYIITFCII